MACLDENHLLQLIQGRIAPSEREGVEQHLDECPDCRRLVAEAVRGSATDAAPMPWPASPTGDGPPSFLGRGTNVGRYVILRPAGAGAMGVVYVAYDPELDRKVALKLLRVDGDGSGSSEAHRGRLLREAQAMARLSHPNVVTVFDAGTFAERVFIAMELVEGETLRHHLQEKDLGWRAILQLFLQAGRGLAAAHAAGIVHRDFKPDNVLVGDDGTVRVTDFGLARADPGPRDREPEEASPASSRSDLGVEVTREGVLVGTPAYMAPELIQGHRADRRTDLFSFCVACYEALYGERPFAGQTLPELRSAVLRGATPAGSKSARVPARVRRVLLRGLSASPDDRYPSMDDLLRDLASDPRRRWRRLLVAAGFLAVVVGALVVYDRVLGERGQLCQGAERKLAGVWDADRKRQAAAAFRATGVPFADDAWRGVERALDVYRHNWVKMHHGACEATRIRGEQSESDLELRMRCLRSRRVELGALTDLLLRADRRVVKNAVVAAHGLPDLQICAEIETLRGRQVPPRDRATAARALEVEQRVARAWALARAGKVREARRLADAVLAEARRVAYQPVLAAALNVVGHLQRYVGQFQAAEKTYFEAFVEATAIREDRVAAEAALDLLWVIARRLHRFDEGLRWGRLAEAALRRLGKSPQLRARLHSHLGSIDRVRGRYPEAIAHHRRAVAITERALPHPHSDHATALNNLAIVFLDRGDYAEGTRLLRRALALEKELGGELHPSVAKILNTLGQVLFVSGHLPAALAAHRRALAIFERTGSANSSLVARALKAIGTVLARLGHYRESLRTLEQALAKLRSPGAETFPAAWTRYHLAHTLRLMGRHREALGQLRRARAVVEKRRGSRSTHLGWCLIVMGAEHTALGRFRTAEPLLRRALDIFHTTHGPQHSGTASALQVLGRLARRRGRYAEALKHLRTAVAAFEHNRGFSAFWKARVFLDLGLTHLEAGQPARAVAPLERARRFCESAPGDPSLLAMIRFALAQALWRSGTDRPRALRLAGRARGTFLSRREYHRADLARVRRWLARRTSAKPPPQPSRKVGRSPAVSAKPARSGELPPPRHRGHRK